MIPKKERISEKDKRRNKIVIRLFLIIIIIIILLLLLRRCDFNIPSIEPDIPDDTNPIDTEDEPEEVNIFGIYKDSGITYTQNPNIKTVLAVGTNGDDAEYILLVIVDKKNEILIPIHISRRTICNYYTLDNLGKVTGSVDGRIEKSFGNGSRDITSLNNVKDAVQRLFCNMRIDFCMMLDLKDVDEFVDNLGSTKFKLTDDYINTAEGLSFRSGDSVTITPNNATPLIKGDEISENYALIERRQNRYIDSLFYYGQNKFLNNNNYFHEEFINASRYITMSSNDLVNLMTEVGAYPKASLIHVSSSSDAEDYYPGEAYIKTICFEYIYNE